jgi:hypothetical protein
MRYLLLAQFCADEFGEFDEFDKMLVKGAVGLKVVVGFGVEVEVVKLVNNVTVEEVVIA